MLLAIFFLSLGDMPFRDLAERAHHVLVLATDSPQGTVQKLTGTESGHVNQFIHVVDVIKAVFDSYACHKAKSPS
jgi:hypothetical protein